jgi:ATP-dependent helicase HrpB
VPIGTKLPKSGKKIKGAPRGKRTSVSSAVSTATGGAIGSNWNVDERAIEEAEKVCDQLLGNLRRVVKSHPGNVFAPGVGDGDPSGTVWMFLCGAGESEIGLLLAAAYPDRVGVRKNRGGAFQLSGGGAASVGSEHKDDPLLQSIDKSNEILIIVELAGDGAGNAGSRNDRIRMAAPIDRACFEGPDGPLYKTGLSKEGEDIFWASASKSVFARKRLTVGNVILKESPISVSDRPEATVEAMLEGIREMGFAASFGLSKNASIWLRRAAFVQRSGVDPTFPDLSEESLLRSAHEWLAPWISVERHQRATSPESTCSPSYGRR